MIERARTTYLIPVNTGSAVAKGVSVSTNTLTQPVYILDQPVYILVENQPVYILVPVLSTSMYIGQNQYAYWLI